MTDAHKPVQTDEYKTTMSALALRRNLLEYQLATSWQCILYQIGTLRHIEITHKTLQNQCITAHFTNPINVPEQPRHRPCITTTTGNEIRPGGSVRWGVCHQNSDNTQRIVTSRREGTPCGQTRGTSRWRSGAWCGASDDTVRRDRIRELHGPACRPRGASSRPPCE